MDALEVATANAMARERGEIRFTAVSSSKVI